jgi:DNA-binding beta-propeller fold protein YncE
MSHGPVKLLAGCVLIGVLAVSACGGSASGSDPTAPRRPLPASDAPRVASLAATVHHYLYAFPDQAMYVYDIDHGHRLVQHVALPGIGGIRGVAASPRTHMLYISHGGDGGGNGNGSLLAYDLRTNKTVWDRSYSRGIDSMAVTPDGSRIYMPDGELSSDGIWTKLDAATGQVIGQISAGAGPHNTIVSLNGKRVYLGGRDHDYLEVASAATGRVIKRIGPLQSGVRPFTINGSESLAYTTATGFLGFQVSNSRTGHVLYTKSFGPRFKYDPGSFSPSAPSHGISLSPDERQLWVIDAPNSYVHVFDVTPVPRHGPRRIADVKLPHPLTGDESGCSYDCARDGWLLVSRSGCFAYVGDSGDVISTRTFRRVAFLPALRNSRKYIEIDWSRGAPIATTTRSGLGYVTHGPRPRRPTCG